MANSSSVTVEARYATTETQIVQFDINPKAGQIPLMVTAIGYLSFFSDPTPDTFVGGERLNGETIWIEQYDGANWVDTGLRDITRSNAGNRGYFAVNIGLDEVGLYQFRAHYPGNTDKALTGCEKNSRQ